MIEFFNNFAHEIIFLHILGAIIWVGGMIATRIAVHPVMLTIDEPKIRVEKSLKITLRLFNLVMPFIAIILITALIMAIALDGHHGNQKMLFISKEAIWSVMTINYIAMYIIRSKAWKLFEAGDIKAAGAKAKVIPEKLLPINIFLGVVALWLGVSLRGY